MGIQLDGITDHNSVNALISPVDLGNIETGNDYSFVVSWDPNPDNDINTPEGELTVYFR